MFYSSDQKSSVAGETVERIAEMIRNGQYLPGDRLPGERQLAKELQVSRTSIREALSRLETVGLVECRHGLGTFVKEPSRERLQSFLVPHILIDQEKLQKLFEVREILEVEAAARAAQRADTGKIGLMRRWVEELETQVARDNVNGIVTADIEFHRQIIIATGNEMLVDLHDNLANLLRAARRGIIVPEMMSEMITSHRAILSAIEAADSQAARQAMQEHLASVFSRIKSLGASKES